MTGAHELAARAGYCGITPPPAPPVPRDGTAIAQDLADAAESLYELAGTVFAGAVTESTLSNADRLLVGAGRLIAELRQGQRA